MDKASNPHLHDASCEARCEAQTPSRMQWLAAGSALAIGAVVLAPYLLPMIGIGNENLAEQSMLAFHGTAANDGLAGAINSGLSKVPLIGSTLAGGGFSAALASATIGLGGYMLGKHWQESDDTSKQKLGTAIAVAALATSALIALPSLLTGISIGVVYLCAAFSGVRLASMALSAVAPSIGAIKGAGLATASTLGGAAAIAPHIASCGMAIVPGALSVSMLDKERRGGTTDTAGRTVYKPVNKQLLPDDPNHNLTSEEQAMVQAYNDAPPLKKPILQKRFRELGYTPDFHADGTMHLHQHTTSLSR